MSEKDEPISHWLTRTCA